MHCSSPAGQRRLEDVGGVDRALGRARADEGVQLVDEEDDRCPPTADLVHDRLQALLELAAVLGAGHHGGQVEGDHPLVEQGLGHLRRRTMRCARPSTMAVLPTPGSPIRHRVVLGAAAEDLDHPLDLLVAADHRVQLALAGELRQVAAKLIEGRGLAAGLGSSPGTRHAPGRRGQCRLAASIPGAARCPWSAPG